MIENIDMTRKHTIFFYVGPKVMNKIALRVYASKKQSVWVEVSFNDLFPVHQMDVFFEVMSTEVAYKLRQSIIEKKEDSPWWRSTTVALLL